MALRTMKMKSYKRTLAIDFDAGTYEDERICKTNKGKGYEIISTILFDEIKQVIKKAKFKRIKENNKNEERI